MKRRYLVEFQEVIAEVASKWVHVSQVHSDSGLGALYHEEVACLATAPCGV